MPDRWFETTRTVRRRAGYYSQDDIHVATCSYEAGGAYNSIYYGSYNLSKSKNINITKTATYSINSYEVYYYISGTYKTVMEGYTMQQQTTVQVVPNPSISINSDLGVIGNACNIEYNIYDSNPDVRFKVITKLNDVIINEEYNRTDSKYVLNLTYEHLSELVFNSINNITIELDNGYGSIILNKTVTFTKGNTKPKLSISSYDSTSATFTAIDVDNNLSKIEWYLDNVLKETITTDLYLQKTINYELLDNAIHTLKIIATDTENATAEKVVSVSKNIMPLEEDASLNDISDKVVEMKDGLKSGKISIANVLSLKNIEANLSDTLVELSEKIRTSFNSSDASLEQLKNQLIEKNNTITNLQQEINKRYKYYSRSVRYSTGNYNVTTVQEGGYTGGWYIQLPFIPKALIIASSKPNDLASSENYFSFNFLYSQATHGSFNSNNTIGFVHTGSSSIKEAICSLFISNNISSKGSAILYIKCSESTSNSFGCILNICAFG